LKDAPVTETRIAGVTELAWFGEPAATARLGVLLVHGRTQDPEAMREMLVDRLALPGVRYLAPRSVGDSWYPSGFLAPAADNEPRLTESIAALGACSEVLAAEGFPQPAQVVLGFSQGACLGSEYVWRSQQAFGALLALTGGLIGPKESRHWAHTDPGARAWNGMPVLLGGSTEDPWVPAFTMRETADVFASHGAQVRIKLYESKVHEVPDDQIALARAILTELRDRRR
jgi:phospholipase/carboxylesterase